MRNGSRITVAISIDTEEDDWGAYAREGESVENIAHLRELQDCFDRYGARPTYLVNRAPLLDAGAVEILGGLTGLEQVEIGAHCHPWNTPPHAEEATVRTMMCNFSTDENRAKLAEVRRLLSGELGVVPKSFRAGRWGFGPTVAQALVDEGFEIDCSVSPYIDWSSENGPDYTDAPDVPYRFDPSDPLTPTEDGALLQLPTTVGYLSGVASERNRIRRRLELGVIHYLKVVGLLDTTGILARRWFSPEGVDGETMIRLADNWVAHGHSFLQLTFHSCTLLPGATPFVRDEHDRARFMQSLNRVLAHLQGLGVTFRTLSEAAAHLAASDAV